MTSTRRAYRPYNFTNPKLSRAANTFGKVNSADKFYLVVESVKTHNKHKRDSTLPPQTDRAGGQSID